MSKKHNLLLCKCLEYEGRMGTAFLCGDMAKTRQYARTALNVCRMLAREVIAARDVLRENISGLRRALEKMKVDGITSPLGEARIQQLQSEKAGYGKYLVSIGKSIYEILNLWQQAGATFDDLCNLCNRDPAQVRKELLESENTTDSFSKLAMVHNLDYKNPRDTGWLEDTVDAPLTHALKAYMLDTMLHTEAGQKAAHEALKKAFPVLFEQEGGGQG